jgi:hypothetical protein
MQHNLRDVRRIELAAAWYSAHCDGEWEHGFGVTIATLDNPGWSVTIDVEGTQLASTPFESVKTAVSDTSWVRCHVTERKERRLVVHSLPAASLKVSVVR